MENIQRTDYIFMIGLQVLSASGLCVRLCPMENLVIKNNKATAESRCTMCYRCISSCPQQAITLLGDTVVEQCRYERYVKE